MFETIANFFKKLKKSEKEENSKSKTTAKERLHLVLMQDRANVSADFLELMKQEILEVIKRYIDVEEEAIDVRLTNKVKDDGTTGAPFLYANIPILNIKNDMKKGEPSAEKKTETNKEKKVEDDKTESKEKKEEKNKEKTEEDTKQDEVKNEIAEEVKEAKELIEEVKKQETKRGRKKVEKNEN